MGGKRTCAKKHVRIAGARQIKLGLHLQYAELRAKLRAQVRARPCGAHVDALAALERAGAAAVRIIATVRSKARPL